VHLPADFVFSQDSLQDFVDCRRRFQLKHVLRLAWPGVEAEPVLEHERHLQKGAAFHRLVHQHVSGVPPAALSRTIADEELLTWWNNYLDHRPADLPENRYSELLLTAPLGERRIVARYDLVAVEPGKRAVVVDWKSSRRKPRREDLAERLQTRVYPYLLVVAGASLNGGTALRPEQLEMVYWYAAFPDEPDTFPYDREQYDRDAAYLEELAGEIESLPEGEQPLTEDRSRCRYCVYRSLCERGVGPALLDGTADVDGTGESPEFPFEFGEIEEVVY
jgi:CRISPR/Cas system-associated exonuclease Cas4 (RecB family)